MMSLSDDKHTELLTLLVKWNEGELSEAEDARLQHLMEEDVNARRIYLENMFFYAQLRWQHSRGGFERGVTVGDQEPSPKTSPSPLITFFGPLSNVVEWGATTFSRGINPPVLVSLTTVGLMLILLLIWFLPAPPATEPPGITPPAQYAAQITRMQHCVWTKGSVPLQLGDDVPVGKSLELTAGILEITLETGAQILLEGPCRFELKSDQEGYLYEGRILARAETKQAKGFIVSTSNSKVIDLGTEFGIKVEPSGVTEVHVLRGFVKLDYRDAKGKEWQMGMLQQGQAQRLTADIAEVVNIPADQKTFQEMQSFAALSPLRRWQACRKRFSSDPTLVLYYPFERDKSDYRKLVNVSPAGDSLNGLINRARWTNGRFSGKQALHFHGYPASDFVRVPQEQLFDFLEPFSVVMWFRTDKEMKTSREVLIAKSGSSWFICLNKSNDSLAFQTNWQRHFDESFSLHAKTNVRDGRWHCVAAVCEQIKPTIHRKIYIDGKLENANDSPGSLRQNNFPVLIGNTVRRDRKRTFNGWIDELVIFRRALEAKEVARIYREGNPYATAESPPEKTLSERRPDRMAAGKVNR
ncbi:MAG: FecR domain-containing protein [Pirellulales bacterium]|nr:FecR domain-containing protein [Pirellulales bacterium]